MGPAPGSTTSTSPTHAGLVLLPAPGKVRGSGHLRNRVAEGGQVVPHNQTPPVGRGQPDAESVRHHDRGLRRDRDIDCGLRGQTHDVGPGIGLLAPSPGGIAVCEKEMGLPSRLPVLDL
jgi:hypothetical protein